MTKLPFNYHTRAVIRMLFWVLLLSWIGSMIWSNGVGMFTGAFLGVIFSLVIDEKFYIDNGRSEKHGK